MKVRSPKYLQRVPLDPCSNRALVYRPNGTNWVLYSLGPDKVDDGGKPIDRIISRQPFSLPGVTESHKGPDKGDVFYDSPW